MRRAQMVQYGSLRAGDADRERVLDALRSAYADGRIDHDEFQLRADKVLRALTFAELEPVTADLPGGTGLVRYRPGGVLGQARSGNAVASAALGLGGWLGPTFVAWIPAIVLGHRARAEIRRNEIGGYGLTTIGLAAAYAGLAVQILVLAALIVGLTLS